MKLKKIILIIIGFLVLSLVLFGAWFVWSILNEKQPQFFPFNEPTAEYLITKSQNKFFVNYKGPKIFLNGNGDGSVSVMVGKTNYSLEDLIDKKVIIVKGDFVSSSKQCIQSKCMNIGGPNVVVDIDELKGVDFSNSKSVPE